MGQGNINQGVHNISWAILRTRKYYARCDVQYFLAQKMTDILSCEFALTLFTSMAATPPFSTNTTAAGPADLSVTVVLPTQPIQRVASQDKKREGSRSRERELAKTSSRDASGDRKRSQSRERARSIERTQGHKTHPKRARKASSRSRYRRPLSLSHPQIANKTHRSTQTDHVPKAPAVLPFKQHPETVTLLAIMQTNPRPRQKSKRKSKNRKPLLKSCFVFI